MIIADVSEIESILLRPMGTFDRSSDIINSFSKIIPSALLTLLTNDVYKHHRRVIGTAMTSKYLSRAAPRAWKGVRGLVELWRMKREKADGRGWAVEGDMQGATMVCPHYCTQPPTNHLISDWTGPFYVLTRYFDHCPTESNELTPIGCDL